MAKATKKKTTELIESTETKQAVIVTTEFKGVFCGCLEEYNDVTKVAVLSEARCAVYWGNGVKGFVDLAVNGPNRHCRITTAAKKMKLEKVTSILECSSKALSGWQQEPWG